MEDVKRLIEDTDLTLQQIADECDVTWAQVQYYVARHYSKQFRKERKAKCYSNSKLGDKNPMKNKTGENHPNYIGDISDGKGYRIQLKPEWYTGRKGSKHVFVHTLVMCDELGLTELPAGFVVHHIDGDKTNNSLNNLALLTNGAHTRLHQLERATTSRKA